MVEEFYQDNGKTQWTKLIDQQILKLQSLHKVKPSEISNVMSTLPTLHGMREVLQAARDLGAYIVIASDANEFFIKSFLDGNNLNHLIDEIHTNWAPLENGVIRIKPYTPENVPHGCTSCGINQCKGKIIKNLVSQLTREKNVESVRIVYVGDGENDFCPATNLDVNDALCVRFDTTVVDALGLYTRMNKPENSGQIKANIIHWKTMEEIQNTISSIFV